MKTEIETRFLEIDKMRLILKLTKLKAVDLGEVKLSEVIFYDQDLNWLKDNKLVKLRKDNNIVKLIYKNNKEQKTDSAKEIEFDVSNMDKAKEFLEVIGLRAYREVEKYRHTFTLCGVRLDIDTWPRIPTYVELEGNSIGDLKKVAQMLDLVWKNRFDGDPRFVYKKYESIK